MAYLWNHSMKWMVGIILMMALMACSHHDENEAQPTMLRLYVYAPGNPIQTRVDKGEVDATEGESTIHQLQIWVFRHTDGEKVAYFSPESTDKLNTDNQDVYLFGVPEWFGDEKSNVDVYVLANGYAANCGIALDANTTRAQLDAAIMNDNAFGLTTLIDQKSVSHGLPMSGVLKNQTVSGKNPVLHIGEENQVATVKLARAVSKVRFVFASSSAEGVPDVTIDDIVLNAGMIPSQEYLFLTEPYNGRNFRVGTEFNALETSMLRGEPKAFVVAETDDPAQFVYTIQESQAYETLITTGVNEGKLSQKGPFYLHETDKKLSGVIKYHLGNEAQKKQTTFAVKTAGDFSRNHTWIVYAFCGAATLEVITVQIQNWNVIENELEHKIYNW